MNGTTQSGAIKTSSREERVFTHEGVTRRRVTVACVPCKTAHVACTPGRPCQRCIDLSLQSECINLPQKKRGKKTYPYRSLDSVSYPGTGNQQPKGQKRKREERDTTDDFTGIRVIVEPTIEPPLQTLLNLSDASTEPDADPLDLVTLSLTPMDPISKESDCSILNQMSEREKIEETVSEMDASLILWSMSRRPMLHLKPPYRYSQ